MGVQQYALLLLFFTFELDYVIREDQENKKGLNTWYISSLG